MSWKPPLAFVPCQRGDDMGRCCCNCKFRLTDYSHPLTDKNGIMAVRGYVCAAPEFDGVFSGWSEHGLCEMWQEREKKDWENAVTTYLKWDAPTTGPRPDGYEVYADGFFYARTDKTEIAIPGRDAETEYVVFSYRIVAHPEGNEFIRSKPVALTIGFRITAIEIRDNGVILSFPTRIGSMYTVEKATDLNGPWTEIARFMAAMETSRVGGDPLQESAVYRAWRLS